MQTAAGIRHAKGMKPWPWLRLTVFNIPAEHERVVDKHLLRFGLSNTVFVGALPGVALVPLKAGDLVEVRAVFA